jgi:hypothetical protein
MTTQLITSVRVLAFVASIVSSSPPVPTDPGSDSVFHPDYSRALSVEQMTVAWNAEINRLFPVPITGGG